eukprot:Nitzschia sp. Nitz4//scaffold50_size126154//88557//90662//NITZ4_003694-RA/size126154-augustus-gene-0.9-mRNA-1//1//CDS//3329553725//4478//frame0
MKFSATTVVALVAALVCSSLHSADAFVSSMVGMAARRMSHLQAVDAQVFQDYMAKAHEEKLKAIKFAEDQKKAEIERLKAEVQELKTKDKSPGAGTLVSVSGMSIEDMSKDQIVERLLSYQQFMAKYIVDSQEQKAQAVQAAQQSLKQQFASKLALLANDNVVMTTPATSDSTGASSLFQQRNAMVVASASAGMSRWGDMEIAKAALAAGKPVPPAQPAKVVTNAVDVTSSPVAAAASSKPVGSFVNFGASLVQGQGQAASAPSPAPAAAKGGPVSGFVNFGAQLVGAAPVTPASKPAAASAPPTNDRFAARNSMVVAAANAGKSRWGDMEIEKAKSGSTTSSSTSGAVEASTSSNPRFDARNAMVVAAANAGKSRWGDMEIEKAKSMASSSGSTAASSNPRFDARNAMVVAAANAGMSRWGDMEIEKAKSMASSSGSSAASVTSSSSNPRFDARNAMVVAAAKAGMSRWGDMEVEKAKSMASSSGSSAASVTATSSNPRFDARNAMVVAAAKAGMSRWGDMEIEKAKSMASAPAASASVTASSSNPRFDARNAMVVAAANAGKSRWGELEIEKAKSQAQASSALSSSAVSDPTRSRYDTRNLMLVAAAKAGKSRWGDVEVSKAQELVAGLPSSPSMASVVSNMGVDPVVAAKPQGFVNFGASLVA